ncbi:MAG TPA: PAS domain S-box protein [Acidimicrobiales bacterium]|nr:PAS domain S-box protein [Acidimicrobiales bacterium]
MQPLDDAQDLLALAHDAVIVRTAGDRITFWNRGAEETYGWTPAEALGAMTHDLLRTPSSSRASVEAALRAHGTWEGELRHVRRDGTELVVSSRQVLRRSTGDRQHAVLEINRDITQSKEAEHRLKESDERLRLIIEGVQDYAIFMLDTDGVVVSWNPGAERIKGYRAEEICGQHFSRFYPPEDVDAGKPTEELRTAAAVGRVEDEGWRVRKDGSRFWASVVISALRDADGNLRGFAKVTRDFTERRRAEARLEFQARLLDYVNDAIVAADENLVLTAWNSGAERLYGWQAEEVIGRTTIDVLGTELSDSDREEALRVLNDGGEWRGEVVQRHKDGHKLDVEAAAIVLPDGPTRVFSVNRDVSERRRALIAEERGRIARDLHDSVSQALFSITLQARALQLALQRECHDPHGPVGQGIANVRQLTQGALAEMRALIFELRPDALAEEGLVAALGKHLTALEAKEGLTVTLLAPDEEFAVDPSVEENLYRLAQEALSNIVKHARATSVQVRLAWHGGELPGLELEVSDDGIGFDTSLRHPGHLGLRTMSERAEALGGFLEVTSVPGRGTTVRASLPGRTDGISARSEGPQGASPG